MDEVGDSRPVPHSFIDNTRNCHISQRQLGSKTGQRCTDRRPARMDDWSTLLVHFLNDYIIRWRESCHQSLIIRLLINCKIYIIKLN